MKQFPVPLIFVVLLLTVLPFPRSAATADEWIYSVKQGDNLWSLSKTHLKSMRYWRDLVELNGIDDPYNIPPGTTLRFPTHWLKSGASVAEVVDMTGSATITRREGQKVSVDKGSILWSGDSINTAKASSVGLRFPDGSQILLQAGTEVQMGQLMSYGEGGSARTELYLRSGRSHNKVVPQAGGESRFEISTPSATAAVRGTEYRISAESDGSSRTEVLTGAVGIDSSGNTNVINKGFGTVTYRDQKPLPPTKLLTKPDLSGLTRTITRVPFPLQVTPVKGAVQYRIQISKTQQFSTLLYDEIYPTVNLWGPDLADGQYFLRVSGIDNNGLEGYYTIHTFQMDAHPVPPIPVSPAVNEVVKTPSPTFRWSEPEEASSYVFQLAEDETLANLITEQTGLTQPKFTLQDELTPGLYYWRLASIDRNGKRGPFNDPQQFRCPPPSPDMSTAEMDTASMVYRWPAQSKDNSYHIRIATDESFSDPIEQRLVNPEFKLESLSPGSYYIQVAVVTNDGFQGPYSPLQKITIPAPPPHPLAVIGVILSFVAIISL